MLYAFSYENIFIDPIALEYHPRKVLMGECLMRLQIMFDAVELAAWQLLCSEYLSVCVQLELEGVWVDLCPALRVIIIYRCGNSIKV